MSDELQILGNDVDGWQFKFFYNGREIFANAPHADPYASRQKCLQGINAARKCIAAPVVQIMPDGSRVPIELPESEEPVDEQAEEAIMRQADPTPFENG